MPPLCKGGIKGGLSKSREQSLSHFVTAPFTGFPQKFLNFCGMLQGSLWNRAGMTTLPSALFNRLPRSRRRKERRRQRSRSLLTMAKTSVRRAGMTTPPSCLRQSTSPCTGEAREEAGSPPRGSLGARGRGKRQGDPSQASARVFRRALAVRDDVRGALAVRDDVRGRGCSPAG